MIVDTYQRRERPKLSNVYASHHPRCNGEKEETGFQRKKELFIRSKPITPVDSFPSWQYSYDPYFWAPQIPAYSMPQQVLPMYMPMAYNNYAAYPYASQSQLMMVPPQSIPQYWSMAVSNLPYVASPYSYSPHYAGMVMSQSYKSQPPQVRPLNKETLTYIFRPRDDPIQSTTATPWGRSTKPPKPSHMGIGSIGSIGSSISAIQTLNTQFLRQLLDTKLPLN